ncbi:MAG: hypothetical protein ACE5R6_16805 [Candidatus Heimdallarchaeota archaeon]
MSDQEQKDTLPDASEFLGVKLEHVEPESMQDVVTPMLKCVVCGSQQDLPQHCGEPMKLQRDNQTFKCVSCDDIMPFPQHCDQPMQIHLVRAGS